MDNLNESPLTPKQIETWPGGVKTISGGTRCTINLDRPWQPEIAVPEDTTKCALCNKLLPEQILETYHDKEAGKWLRIQNWYTPYDPERKGAHQMIIPKQCLPATELRELGGIPKIKMALNIALRAMNDKIKYATPDTWTLSAHIGPLAGQNIPHLHWHIIMPDAPNLGPCPYLKIINEWNKHRTPKCYIMDNGYWSVHAAGNRAGQCILLPQDYSQLAKANSPQMLRLANAIHTLINLGNSKFRSNQCLTPHFSIALSLLGVPMDDDTWGITLTYGLYTPILNNWGGTEALAPFTGQPHTLAWPHEMTAAYLRGELEL